MSETPELCIFLNENREVGSCVRCPYLACTVLANTVDPENIRALAQGPTMDVCEAGRARPPRYIQDPLPFEY